MSVRLFSPFCWRKLLMCSCTSPVPPSGARGPSALPPPGAGQGGAQGKEEKYHCYRKCRSCPCCSVHLGWYLHRLAPPGRRIPFVCWRCALCVNPDLGVPGNPAASSFLSKAVFIKLRICSTQAVCRNAPDFKLSIKRETVKWKSGTLSKQSLFCIQQRLWKRSTLLFALQGSRPALVMGQEPVYTRLQQGNNNLQLLEMKGFWFGWFFCFCFKLCDISCKENSGIPSCISPGKLNWEFVVADAAVVSGVLTLKSCAVIAKIVKHKIQIPYLRISFHNSIYPLSNPFQCVFQPSHLTVLFQCHFQKFCLFLFRKQFTVSEGCSQKLCFSFATYLVLVIHFYKCLSLTM